MTDKAQLEQFRKWFSSFWTNTLESRELSERDRDYYDNIQLTEEELAEMKKRGQPPTIKNKIKQKIDYMIGLEQKSRTDPKAYPRTPNHDKDGEAATDGLRYVADNTFFKNKKTKAFKNLAIEGTCALELVFNKKTKEIDINYIPWNHFWYDHLSRELDFSDGMYRGMYKWVDVETLKGKIGEHDALAMGVDEMPDDEEEKFFDQERKRIRVFDVYYKKNDSWWYAQFTGSGFIIEPEESQYTEDVAGNQVPTYAIIAQSAFTTRKGIRYGYVRELISDQDAINKRSSKALHLLNNNQVIADKGAVDDVQKARAEADKPNGYVEVNPGKNFEINKNIDLVQTQYLLLQQDIADLEAAGANAALSGKDDGVASGRAIQLNQQGGAIEIGGIYDSLKILEIACYRRMWNLIKQFKDEEWWVRVTDDEEKLKYVGFNRRITRLEKMIEEMGQDQTAAILEQEGISPDDPRLHQEIIENQVSEIDVDIIIEDAPDITNIQGEQFDQIVQLAQASQGTDKPIPFDVILEASSLRNKDKLLKKMRGEDEDGQAQLGQLQQQLQEAAQRIQEMEGLLEQSDSIKSENENLKLQLTNKSEEIDVKQFEAETKRMQVQLDAAVEKITRAIQGQEELLNRVFNNGA